MSESEVQLVYFGVRGKGEMVRLLFHAAGQPFEDNVVEFSTWGPSCDAKKDSPYGQLPYVVYKGKKYAQSLAIASFFAGKFGLKGKTAEDGLKTDEIIQLVEDARPLLRDWIMAGFMQKDEDKKAAAAKKASEDGFPKFFAFWEEMLLDNGGNGYFIGDSVTLADLVVYDYLDTALNIAPDCLAVFPSLQKLRTKVEADPKVAAYLKDRPKTEF